MPLEALIIYRGILIKIPLLEKICILLEKKTECILTFENYMAKKHFFYLSNQSAPLGGV